MFQCLASNEAGEKSSYTWLKVKSKFVNFSSLKKTIIDLAADYTTGTRNTIFPLKNKI